MEKVGEPTELNESDRIERIPLSKVVLAPAC
jgi:hypothetical protein